MNLCALFHTLTPQIPRNLLQRHTHLRCIYTYTYIHIHKFICVYTHTLAHTPAYTHAHTHTYRSKESFTKTHPHSFYIYIYIHTHTQIYVCTHSHTRIYTRLHTHTHTHIQEQGIFYKDTPFLVVLSAFWMSMSALLVALRVPLRYRVTRTKLEIVSWARGKVDIRNSEKSALLSFYVVVSVSL